MITVGGVTLGSEVLDRSIWTRRPACSPEAQGEAGGIPI
jgi:hypothetical protein